MSNFKKLPFGIDFVVEQDLVPQGIRKYSNSTGYSFNCPFCEKKGLKPDKHHKYSVNIYKNVGNCLRCGTGHGILSLHRDLAGGHISIDEAKQDLLNRWNHLPSNVQIEMTQVKERLDEENARQLEPAPTEICDEVYRKFLSQLTLSEKHKKDLLNRGLTEEEIEKGMYKSVPQCGFTTIASNCFSYEIRDALKRHIKWGIPGFYDIREKEPKVVRCDNGYFVPVRNEIGLISGMQIRYDNLPDNAPAVKKEHFAKYKWFVSNYKEKKDGCTASGCENIHYTGDFSSPKQVILTEGVLKADIASIIGGKIKGQSPIPVLGLVGVYNAENLNFELAKLKDRGLEKVTIAVDMDYREKPQVAKALGNIKERIEYVGLKYEIFNWNSDYKGIDDFLKAVWDKQNESKIK